MKMGLHWKVLVGACGVAWIERVQSRHETDPEAHGALRGAALFPLCAFIHSSNNPLTQKPSPRFVPHPGASGAAATDRNRHGPRSAAGRLTQQPAAPSNA